MSRLGFFVVVFDLGLLTLQLELKVDQKGRLGWCWYRWLFDIVGIMVLIFVRLAKLFLV